MLTKDVEYIIKETILLLSVWHVEDGEQNKKENIQRYKWFCLNIHIKYE